MEEPSTEITLSAHDAASTPTPRGPKAKPRRSSPANPTRQCVELTLRISSMNESLRALLVAATGVNSTDLVDLVVATMSHGYDVRSALSSIRDIGNADVMEAGINATILSSEHKALFKSAWRVLAHLPSGLAAQIPAGSANAGLAFAKAAQSLDEPSRKAVARLLKDLGA